MAWLGNSNNDSKKAGKADISLFVARTLSKPPSVYIPWQTTPVRPAVLSAQCHHYRRLLQILSITALIKQRVGKKTINSYFDLKSNFTINIAEKNRKPLEG
jgi:hypothetical protein